MDTEERIVIDSIELGTFIGDFVKDFGPGPAKEITQEMKMQAEINRLNGLVEALTEENNRLRIEKTALRFEKEDLNQKLNTANYKLKVRKRELKKLNNRLLIHSLEGKYLSTDVESTLVTMLEQVQARKAANTNTTLTTEV